MTGQSEETRGKVGREGLAAVAAAAHRNAVLPSAVLAEARSPVPPASQSQRCPEAAKPMGGRKVSTKAHFTFQWLLHFKTLLALLCHRLS